MKKVILSQEIADKFEKSTNFSVIPLKAYEKLDIPVNSHPDMLLFIIDNTVFCYEEYYNLNEEIFLNIERLGYKIIKIEKECKKKYPHDVSLNVLKIGKFLLGKEKYIAKEILTYANENNYTVIDVNQGYSACSTLVLDENTAITNDKSIEKAIKLIGKNAILISNDDIILKGYDCGFIGGASVVIDDTVYFFGNVDTLRDEQKIKDIIFSLNMNYICISSGRVFDFGGSKIIKSY